MSLWLFSVVWIFSRSPGVNCYYKTALSEGQKTISRIGVSWTQGLFSQFLPFFDSVKWPYYQKHVSQIILSQAKLSFTNIRGLPSNFTACQSFFWIRHLWYSCSLSAKFGWLSWFSWNRWGSLNQPVCYCICLRTCWRPS